MKSRRPIDAFPLALHEPLDIDGQDLDDKGSFTAVRAGLRLDHLGSLSNVFRLLDGRSLALRSRARRMEVLGMFQAIVEGEVIPVGSYALIDDALVRIDAL